MRTILNCCLSLAALGLTSQAAAQDPPGKRLAGIVAVAVEEYRLGVTSSGAVQSKMELNEARAFLAFARDIAAKLSGERAPAVRALVDTLAAAVDGARPSTEVDAIYDRLVVALGPDAALDQPSRRVDLAAGRSLYEKNCASCHGDLGRGDGLAAAGLTPPPAALSDTAMRGVSPALMYRVVSVGVQGTSMMAWAQKLTPDERWDVVSYVNTLRSAAGDAARGNAALATRCAECSRSPASFTEFAWLADRSDEEIVAALRDGNADAGLPSLGALSDTVALQITAHLRELGASRIASTGGPLNPRAVERAVSRLLDSALAAMKANHADLAADLAFDAYVAFEPLENAARVREPRLVARAEAEFLAFRGATQTRDVASAAAAVARIRTDVGAIAELAAAPARGWPAFFQSLIIILREGFEAILIIGAIVAFLARTGNKARIREVWLGAGFALAASAVTAIVLQTTLRALPATREVIEGVTMLVAVVVLFAASYWILSKVEAERWKAYIRERISSAVSRGGSATLMATAFLVVYREGAETVLFYQALLQNGPAMLPPVTAGFVVGAVALAVIYEMSRRFGARVPLRPFFATTGLLLYAMAFVFVGNGVRELQEGRAVSITPVEGIPHVDFLGVYPTVETLTGQVLLIALFAVACWRSFGGPWVAARVTRRQRAAMLLRESQAAQLQSIAALASRESQPPRTQAQSPAQG